MQPISTTRCPSSGLRPVVSVSMTISRMPGFWRTGLEQFDHGFESPQAMAAAKPCGYHEIRTPALLRIRHLARQHGGEFLTGHAGPLQHARKLHERWRRYHRDVVGALVAADLEQQRHIDGDQAVA